MRLAALTVLLVGCVAPLDQSEMQALKSETMAFALEETDYPSAPTPEIKVVPSIRQEYLKIHGEDWKGLDLIFSLYDSETNTIYVDDSVDLRSTDGKALIAHEMTHALQFAIKDKFCRHAAETEAYGVQSRFHDHHDDPVNWNPEDVARKLYGNAC